MPNQKVSPNIPYMDIIEGLLALVCVERWKFVDILRHQQPHQRSGFSLIYAGLYDISTAIEKHCGAVLTFVNSISCCLASLASAPNATTIRTEENISKAIDEASSRWFWVILLILMNVGTIMP